MLFRSIQFHRGLPDPRHLTQWFGRTRGGVLVLDDLMEEGGQDKRVLELFRKDSYFPTIFHITKSGLSLNNKEILCGEFLKL